jgi:DNA repair protein RecO (recombination protein O)
LQEVYMHWRDEGIVLGVAPYGDRGALVQVFAETQGVTRGMTGSRQRQGLAAGGVVDCQWQARLPEHLGTFTLESKPPFLAGVLAMPLKSQLLGCVCRLLAEGLPRGMAYPALYQQTRMLLEGLLTADNATALAWYAWWECFLLAETGYGLDLTACALTGTTENLAYVSPRTGRAVNAEAARPWVDKLLPLPGFLRGTEPPRQGVTRADSRAALRLCGYFLERAFWHPAGKGLPAVRGRLMDTFFRTQRLTEASLALSSARLPDPMALGV